VLHDPEEVEEEAHMEEATPEEQGGSSSEDGSNLEGAP
jgi:hypothetical protein